MKKITYLLGLWLALVTATALALNPIEARVGPVRCFIISSTVAFASEHSTRPFSGAISLSKQGTPYEPGGTSWVRFTDSDGKVSENRISDFSVRLHDRNGLDGVLLSPYRPFPAEAIEPVATAHVGDTLYVVSLRLLTTVTAKVTSLHPEDYTVDLDFPADSGDSSSVVLTGDGTFVGFVSAKRGEPEFVSAT